MIWPLVTLLYSVNTLDLFEVRACWDGGFALRKERVFLPLGTLFTVAAVNELFCLCRLRLAYVSML